MLASPIVPASVIALANAFKRRPVCYNNSRFKVVRFVSMRRQTIFPLAAPSPVSHHQRKELIRRAQSGHVPRIEALLDDDADTEFVADTGMSPLMTAAYAGHTEIVSLLLAAGASPRLTANDGASALHWAARNGHHDIVRLLLDAGADVNARRDADGPTPLHMALGNGHDAVAITLIDAGTSMDTPYIGKDVSEFAEWCGCDLVLQYLNQRRGRRTNHGRNTESPST